jgi:hypothetical protein
MTPPLLSISFYSFGDWSSELPLGAIPDCSNEPGGSPALHYLQNGGAPGGFSARVRDCSR